MFFNPNGLCFHVLCPYFLPRLLPATPHPQEQIVPVNKRDGLQRGNPRSGNSAGRSRTLCGSAYKEMRVLSEGHAHWRHCAPKCEGCRGGRGQVRGVLLMSAPRWDRVVRDGSEMWEKGRNFLFHLKVTWQEVAGKREARSCAQMSQRDICNPDKWGSAWTSSTPPQLQRTGKGSGQTGLDRSRGPRALVTWKPKLSLKVGRSRHIWAREADIHTLRQAPLRNKYCLTPQCGRGQLHSLLPTGLSSAVARPRPPIIQMIPERFC